MVLASTFKGSIDGQEKCVFFVEFEPVIVSKFLIAINIYASSIVIILVVGCHGVAITERDITDLDIDINAQPQLPSCSIPASPHPKHTLQSSEGLTKDG